VEWLVKTQNTTPREMYAMFSATGRPWEYQKAMEYLRRKYAQEMQYRESLIASNPFVEPEQTN
jgi:hypothetical protein